MDSIRIIEIAIITCMSSCSHNNQLNYNLHYSLSTNINIVNNNR